MRTCPGLLNENYYIKLLNKFYTSNVLLESCKSNFIHLNIALFESFLKKSICFVQLPSGYECKNLLYANIFYRIFLEQILSANENPIYNVGTKVKANSSNKEFEVINLYNDLYTIKETIKGKKNQYYSPVLFTNLTKKNLREKFTIIEGGLQNRTIGNYKRIIELEFNLSYVPTLFSSKSIIICSKTFWDSLYEMPIVGHNLDSNLKSIIPATYVMGKDKSIKSINIDNALYVTSDYAVAYNEILKSNLKVNSIVLFDCKINDIHPILQDQQRKQFSLYVYSTDKLDNTSFPVWKWLKEEIELIDGL